MAAVRTRENEKQANQSIQRVYTTTLQPASQANQTSKTANLPISKVQ